MGDSITMSAGEQTGQSLSHLSESCRPDEHPPVATGRLGVLLMNLGTPDATDYWSMRRYLREFLSDRRVIDYSPWIWQPILQTMILTRRPSKSGALYRSIWNKELNESPLRTVSRSQAQKLADRLAARDTNIIVDWAMRYGNPSTESAFKRLVDQGCRRIVLIALYPQYASPTTATAYDAVFAVLKKMMWQPSIRTAPPYYDNPLYIQALARSVQDGIAEAGFEPELLLFSYHGMPKRFLLAGDPYYCMCMHTTRLVREALGWSEAKAMTCFQSRFGPEEWLQPYFDRTLENLPSKGVKRIAVISPAFATDCLETLEEIAVSGRETFLAHGGADFAYIRCLNDSEAHIDLLEQMAVQELQGWLPSP
ncbi:ferrochelatase [Arboricoccus pini]|uniref:Ferrochelatase n=1 Tax=Arboricoccus pini TaxID=1963835 RepID=A0A212R4V3_9PROT|nr:ferrochelatase [Arboricoccus pini]SNB67075.1 ferrochelatase [Arboricoccus pini]